MADSDSSDGVERMQLGPSGIAMMQTRSQRVSNVTPRADAPAAASRSDENPDRLQTFFNSAMERFLKEQRAAQRTPTLPLAPDDEKCQVLGGMSTGSARNWYRQLSRTTRGDWKELLSEFQVQFCGLGVSVVRQYNRARKRADETSLEYLYRLNVAGLRAKLRVKSGPSNVRREGVEHFIETLDDRDLADQL
ncbi:hypothetical protein F442_16141, partial [Phytophthora nicotianae P10297]